MKKGFTLVEILVSIVILSIITLIAVLGYKGINRRIKEQEYENKIKYIETQAAAFASDTGYLSTNVQYLVELGYVKADNDKMEVLNPVNKEVLNDYVVTITREGENYYGHFTNYKESDMDKIDMTNENLEIIEISESGKEIGLNEWTQENVSLRGKIKKNRDSEIVKIRWFSNTEEKEIDVQGNFDEVNNYPIDVVQILNTGYRLEIEFSDGTKYEARRTIKVDKQKPVVYREDVKINNEDTYTKNNKKVRIIASDQRGSGIAGYYLGTDPVCKNNQLYKSSEEYYEAELGLGTYYSCVVDNVGNESEAISFEVKNIDTTSPTCTIIPDGTMGKNDWYTSDVTFRIEGNDGESGIRNTSLSSNKLTTDSASYTVEGIVTDKAGNEGKCSLTVKRDATKPTCKFSGESTIWSNASSRTIKMCEDIGSGCDSNYDEIVSVASGGALEKTNISKWIYDKAGNSAYCSKNVNIYLDRIAPECDGWSGENSSWKNSSVTVTAKCKDSNSGCDVVIGTTVSGAVEVSTKNVSNTIKDRAGNTKTCSKNAAQFYYDGVAPYTPYYDYESADYVDGVPVIIGLYGDCGAACVESQKTGVNGGAVNSVGLQASGAICFIDILCENNGKKNTSAIKCRVNKIKYCGAFKISANNTSGGSPIRIEEKISFYECSTTDIPARFLMNYRAVDAAGNVSENLSVSLINSFAYNFQNLKPFYTTTNNNSELYYWKPIFSEYTICGQKSSN